MRFRLTLTPVFRESIIPINYQYPISSAIYKIIQQADSAYASFLHEKGYQQKGSFKSFKLFSFSDLRTAFKIEGDRLRLLTQQAELEICFHLPQAAENFIKGLFMQQQLNIADKKSKAVFLVQSVESLPGALQQYKPQEIINISLKPLSPVVAGLPNEKGNYTFLAPEDIRFAESLVYNWRNKIATCYDERFASSALLMMEVIPAKLPFKSRLITIKAGTPEETKIRGWMNFGLKVTGEKRFVELLLNAGTGIYNSQGMGCLEAIV
ncbi:MAG: CRISPR-associated endoribonuclease Cas6 [Chitinophagaceae bacterium]|nr:CRISPR-associated endoribonuclease Cas6 [Chitinophagaceae bacterium]